MNDSSYESQYQFYVKSAACFATAVALILIILKLYVWFKTDSVGILGSLIDSVLDLLVSATNLLAIRYAVRPADYNHHFGHGKAESLAALIQGILIMSSALFLLYSALDKFLHPRPLSSPEYGVYVSIFATLLVMLLLQYQRKVIRLTDSVAIKADTLHYKTDLYLNAGIAIALLLSWQGFYLADPLFAFGLGLYILYSTFHLIKEAISSLLDEQLPENEMKQIRSLALQVEGVLGIYDLRTRKSGMTRFIQLDIELADHLSLLQAHEIADKVEDVLKDALSAVEVIVHFEPSSCCTHKKD